MAKLLIGFNDGNTISFDDVRYGDIDRSKISFFNLISDDTENPSSSLYIHTFKTEEIPIYRRRTGSEMVHVIGYQVRGTDKQYLIFIHEDGRTEIHDGIQGISSCQCVEAIHHNIPLSPFEV